MAAREVGRVTSCHRHLAPRALLLYIEDNLANFELVKQVLSEQPQIELLWAMQGGIGLHLAEQRHPDLIVLDLHLPDMHGADVLERLKQVETTREFPSSCSAPMRQPGRSNG